MRDRADLASAGRPAVAQPGGNREANDALWRIVITRMSSHPPPAPTSSGTKEGLSKKEIIRCLKRVARAVYRLRARLTPELPRPGPANRLPQPVLASNDPLTPGPFETAVL